MIETYKTEGMFPSNLPGHYFEGPIKAHYRPRRLWSEADIISVDQLISDVLTEIINYL